jgi:hypothetical protein
MTLDRWLLILSVVALSLIVANRTQISRQMNALTFLASIVTAVASATSLALRWLSESGPPQLGVTRLTTLGALSASAAILAFLLAARQREQRLISRGEP